MSHNLSPEERRSRLARLLARAAIRATRNQSTATEFANESARPTRARIGSNPSPLGGTRPQKAERSPPNHPGRGPLASSTYLSEPRNPPRLEPIGRALINHISLEKECSQDAE